MARIVSDKEVADRMKLLDQSTHWRARLVLIKIIIKMLAIVNIY